MDKRSFVEGLIGCLIGWLIVVAGVILLLSIVTIFIGAWTARPVGAAPSGAAKPVFGPPQTVLWVADLDAPAIEVPTAFAVQAVPIVQCESQFDSRAVGAAGERGQFQIHPVHRRAMAERRLDFEKEGDRVRWAVIMWEQRGWRDWSCR